MTDREIMQQALDSLEFPHDSEWSNKAKAIEALQHALAQPDQAFVRFPSFMRKRIEQAMEDAINPKGMSVHDGKATVLASDLHRMLLVIDSVLAQPEQDWNLLAATQESLREHQARIKELEAQLAQPKQSKYSYIVSDGGFDPRNKFDAQPEHRFDTPESHIVKWSIPVDPNNFGEPLAQPEQEPEQEPVAWMGSAGLGYDKNKYLSIPLYTAPQRKTWVGLTDEEINSLYPTNWFEFARLIEAKLKEKNI